MVGHFYKEKKGIGHLSPYTVGDYLKIPIWSKNIWNSIVERANLKDIIGDVKIFDNILINTYEKGDSLIPHTDDVHLWNNWVIGMSIGSHIIMDFT